jgi:hypothetical protein
MCRPSSVAQKARLTRPVVLKHGWGRHAWPVTDADPAIDAQRACGKSCDACLRHFGTVVLEREVHQ